ncbi:MAG: hypothetical protein HDT28_03560 [Clostridiales bacterium]|nr:hypothetical protein [Clostridiales bacterium]
MARKAGELKKRCWLAKQRLKMGYWEAVKSDRLQQSDVAATKAVYAEDRARYAPNDTRLSVLDEKMYRKVCDILDSDEVATNPIGQLIDREVYEGLDAGGKQRYILELSEKFRELKARYYNEHTGA